MPVKGARKHSDGFRAHVASMYYAGLSAAEVAYELGSVSAGTVLAYAREFGCDVRQSRSGSYLLERGPYNDGNGYLAVSVRADHPFASMGQASGNRYKMQEHRLRMAEHLGRPLLRTETVHHINGKRDDNRIENLELRAGHHGSGQRWICKDCGSCNVEAEALNISLVQRTNSVA